MAKRRAGRVKKLVRSLLLTLLMAGVLGALLWFGNAHKVLAEIGRFQHIYLLWFVLVLFAQEVIRWLLWHLLLQALTTSVPPRIQLLAFAAGEAAKFLPTGAYLQNYLLQRAADTDFGLSSAATTVMIAGEIAAALLGFVILGVGAWSFWPRVAILIGMVIVIFLIRVYLAAPHSTRAPRWTLRYKFLMPALGELQRFRAGAAALTEWRIMGITILLSVLYVLTSGAGLYLVVRALGIDGVSFWQAVGVNCFGLAFYMILGSLEAADVGAFIGIGVSNSAAVSVILVNRGLGVGLTLAFSAIVVILLHDEWRALSRRAGHVTAVSGVPEPRETLPARPETSME